MIKVGFIGTGNISGVHLGYLKGRKDVEITALCDIRKEALENRRGQYGGRGYADYRQMLKKEKLDAVWLCTPPHVRQAPLFACAEKSIPVFCEKPVERDAKKARATVAGLKKRRGEVQVGYVLRAMPIVQELKKRVAADSVHAVSSFYMCGVSLTMGLPAWFYNKKLSGGALIDQATHNFDLMRYLLGEVRSVVGLAANPVKKKAKGYTIDETLALCLDFKRGVMAGHTHTWVGDAWRNEIVFSGRKRFYRLDLWQGKLHIEETGKPPRMVAQKGSIYDHENALFLKQVSSGNWKGNISSYADGLKSLELTLACDRALSGRSIKI